MVFEGKTSLQEIEQPDIKWPRLLLIGHRGASATQPENTIPAFKEAIRAGANMVEMDVWKTSDGKLAISHNSKLKGGDIRKITFEEAQKQNPNLCSLDQVVKFFKETYPPDFWAGIYVEIKDPKATELVIGILQKYDFDERSIVGSFSEKTVRELARLKKERKTQARISWLLWGLFPAIRVFEVAKNLGIDFIHPWHPNFPPMGKSLIGRAHREGLKIIGGYTENPQQIEKFKKLDLDGICSNRPDLF